MTFILDLYLFHISFLCKNARVFYSHSHYSAYTFLHCLVSYILQLKNSVLTIFTFILHSDIFIKFPVVRTCCLSNSMVDRGIFQGDVTIIKLITNQL